MARITDRCASERVKRWRIVPGCQVLRGVESLWRFQPQDGRGRATVQHVLPSTREGLESPVAFSEGRRTTEHFISSFSEKRYYPEQRLGDAVEPIAKWDYAEDDEKTVMSMLGKLK